MVGCKVVAAIFGFRDQREFPGDKIIHFLVLARKGFCLSDNIDAVVWDRMARFRSNLRVDASLMMFLLC